MTNLQRLIKRGLEIRDEIKLLEDELKQIEKHVDAAALLSEHVPLAEEDREGRQALIAGPDGIILPVIYESDLVAASLPELGNQMANIRAIVTDPEKLVQLWKPSGKLDRVAKDGQAYRKQLRSMLSPEPAAAVLQASLMRDKTGIPKSRTIIAWDRAAQATKPA